MTQLLLFLYASASRGDERILSIYKNISSYSSSYCVVGENICKLILPTKELSYFSLISQCVGCCLVSLHHIVSHSLSFNMTQVFSLFHCQLFPFSPRQLVKGLLLPPGPTAHFLLSPAPVPVWQSRPGSWELGDEPSAAQLCTSLAPASPEPQQAAHARTHTHKLACARTQSLKGLLLNPKDTI